MSRCAQSFEVHSGAPERVVQGFVAARTEVPRAAGGIVFVAGALLERQEELARLFASKRLGIPLLVVGGSGVLSERGELEGQSAATGLIWSGGSADIGVIDARHGDDGLLEGLERFLKDVGDRAVVLFVPPGGFSPRAVQLLGHRQLGRHIFGGGALGNPGVIAIGAGGELVTGSAVAMSMCGFGVPRVRTTYSCRLLGPLRPITKARGPLVLSLGGEPALDVLSRVGQSLKGQPLVFTVLSQGPGAGDAAAPERLDLLVRGVQGIDPEARGLVISDEVREGMYMSFGVRDGLAARDDLMRLSRELGREIAGAAPLCALYINCGGRGRGLYGRSNVDIRILRERFGGIPIAGMQSSFEIAPYGDSPSFQLYTGVITLFTALS